MVTWRPVLPGRTVLSVVFTSVPALFLIVVVGSVVAGGGRGEPRDIIVACGLLALMTVGAWRVSRMGVYLSDRGVRIQHMADSDVVDWADVHRVVVWTRTRGRIITEQFQEIWLIPRVGEPISTSVIRSLDRPWKGRPRVGYNYAISSDPTFYRTLERLEDGLARWREKHPVA